MQQRNTLIPGALVLILTVSVLAESPHMISYQGRLKDAAGEVVDGEISQMTFSIYDSYVGGNLMWTETQVVIPVDSGLFAVELGLSHAIPDTVFYSRYRYLEVAVNGEIISPRTLLVASPYSMVANSLKGDIYTEPGKLGVGVSDPDENLVVGKNLGARSGNRITIGDDTPGIETGLVVGADADNRAWMLWNIDDNYFSLGTEQSGLGYNTTLTLDSGRVGINNSDPREQLSIGDNLGSQSGDLISIGNAAQSSGVMFGEDSDNMGRIIWQSTYNRMYFMPRDGGTTYNTLTLEQDKVGINVIDPSYELDVDGTGRFITNSASSDDEVLRAEYIGLGSDVTAVFGKSRPAVGYGTGGEFWGGKVGVSAIGDPSSSGEHYGVATACEGGGGSAINYGIWSYAGMGGTNWSGYFAGNVNVTGTLSKGGGSFRIDHPQDPENKWLYHSFVESPDMMNVYNGNVVLDDNGQATVELPDYFGALNRDFRYQLTAIGAPAPDLHIASKIAENRFSIAGGKPGMEVSWQVTGIRKDAYANENRIEVEVDKKPDERGKYAHPQAFGLDETRSVDYESIKRFRRSED